MNIKIKRNTSLSPFLRCSKDPQIYICILSYTIPYTYYGFCTNWGAVRFELVPEFRFDTSISLSIRYIFCSEVFIMSKKISAFSQLSKIQILYLVSSQLSPSPSIPPVCYHPFLNFYFFWSFKTLFVYLKGTLSPKVIGDPNM